MTFDRHLNDKFNYKVPDGRPNIDRKQKSNKGKDAEIFFFRDNLDKNCLGKLTSSQEFKG